MDTKNPNAIDFSSFFAICSSGNLESHAQTFGPLLPWWPLSLGRKQPILPALKETAVQGERRFNQSNWMLFRINSNHLCLHNFGEESCSVTMPRPFKFQTGRADCVEVDLSIHPSRGIYSNKLSWSLDQGRKKDPSLKCISQQTKSITLDPFFSKRDSKFGYKATKAEVHPNPVGNGRSTIEFFRNSFAMTGREVLLGKISNFKVFSTWTRWSPWWELTPLASLTLRSACSPTHGLGHSFWNISSHLFWS